MAEIKWIKLNIDMFDNRKIKQIRKLPGGNDMVLFWVMILTLAGKCNTQGYILLTEKIPYTPEMLATEFDLELSVVKMALEIFQQFNMISRSENLIHISGWGEYQNLEGLEKVKEQNRLRKQKQRAKIKELQEPAKLEISGTESSGHVMSRDSHAIEVEGEVDIEEDITTATTGKENIEDYISFFNKNMGHLLTPHELEIFKSYENDGMEKEVITLALEEAVEADARDIRYIKTVLNRWLDNKITTVEAVLNDKMNFKNKKLKGRHEDGASGCNRKNENKSTGKYQGYRPPMPKVAGEVDTTGLI